MGPNRDFVHRYNDDLLMDDAKRQQAALDFPRVIHVLDDSELRRAFLDVDAWTRIEKREAQAAGFWGVVFALVALLGAASEPLWKGVTAPWPAAIAVVSAGCGLLAFLIATVGLIYGTRKAEWLHRRLFTERLRQMHFQNLIFKLPDIATSMRSQAARKAYRVARNGWIQNFQNEYWNKADSKLAQILDPGAMAPVWVESPAANPDVQIPAGFDPTELFEAYRVLRIQEQEGYALHMLRPSNLPGQASRSLWDRLVRPLADVPLQRTASILEAIISVSLGALVIAHLLIVLDHVGVALDVRPDVLHVLAVASALVALATKTILEGFAVRGEIQRYQEYLAVTSSLHRQFVDTSDPHKQLHLMIEMEKAAFEEMRAFLRTHSEARFVM